MKTIIIDDEINSREILRFMLEKHCSGIELLGMGTDVPTGIAQIRKCKPEMVFLDIEMPGGDGFEVLRAFPERDFRLIFVTGFPPDAYREYAREAIAWLQKPINLDELQSTLAPLGILARQPMANGLDSPARAAASLPDKPDKELLLRRGDGYERIPHADILYLEAQRTYATFFLADGSKRLASYPLGHFEKLLPAEQFFRVHKSYLVNVDQVCLYEVGRSVSLRLQCGQELPIAARRKASFVRFLRDRSNET